MPIMCIEDAWLDVVGRRHRRDEGHSQFWDVSVFSKLRFVAIRRPF